MLPIFYKATEQKSFSNIYLEKLWKYVWIQESFYEDATYFGFCQRVFQILEAAIFRATLDCSI